ncbi:sulfite exporter TauE/SafE family protein [Oscillospiraceae bacterium HV4-5-C5C]|nr:sulfite exporter TauE/SafE family protein [Oscillospiraceae bacterium HV4-5-C5C]
MGSWILATLAAFFIKGLCGFANTLVFNTILTLSKNNVHISPVELLLGYPGNLILAWASRSKIQPCFCLSLSAMVLAGSIPGVFLLKYVDVSLIKAIFGAVVVAIGLQLLLQNLRHSKTRPTRLLTLLTGLLSGVLCGLFGIGALMGAYLSRITDDAESFKANISVVFGVENTFRLILYAVTGILTLATVRQVLLLLPFMLLALGSGMLVSRFMNAAAARRLVIVLLIFSGLALIGAAIF